MKKTILLLIQLAVSTLLIAQAPCNTSFNGSDQCSPEPLTVGNDCVSVAEEFRTNTCFLTLPTASSCGLNTGTNAVWGKILITTADLVTITWTASNNRDISLGLYQYTDGCGFPATGEVEIACADAGGSGADETISQFLAAGEYWICGVSTGNLSAASQICVHSPLATPPIVASDCSVGVPVCTNLNFMIDPNGEGANTTEIPASGSLGNPYYDGVMATPWGTTNMGCLQIDESNSTWMSVNVSGAGDLEFIFGGNGSQAGFYDWIMYPSGTACTDIAANTVAPVRCNWNLVDNGGTGLKNMIPAGGDVGNYEPALPVLAGEVYIICFSNFSSVLSNVPLEFGGTAIVDCTPLPVELVEFYSNLDSREVDLFWRTSSELNSDCYDVQHSLDGVNFSTVGVVDAAGMSTAFMEYEFTHSTPSFTETNYYRLKQVDTDGSFKYSHIETIDVLSDEIIRFYPNPSFGLIHVQTNLKGNQNIKVRIISVTGQEVLTKNIMSAENGTIDVSELHSGSYIIEFTYGQNEKTLKKLYR